MLAIYHLYLIIDRKHNVFEEYFTGLHIQGVTGGTDQTSGECSLGQTIPI
jgi:hypothetical protein